ncbi:unnamed protein product [Bursaphelenchus xylophilus]|uniref:(pine wood nematode) hypothetical protein n=1 Tax=Bursaphelenchus xylophilus TaxID=6326 RepID=A0A1I7RSS6_BURXY|nr:unnamed protein product [Bursaphelenchus xylophilus]CAG9122817.1 unnamed protein product [Bursaphelenchus xylophilus]
MRLYKAKREGLSFWPFGRQTGPEHEKLSEESAVVDEVTLGPDGGKRFGIKSYLHHFYLSPTVEDIEGNAWYLLPPPPAQRMSVYICRVVTLIGLLLLLAGAGMIIVGYTWKPRNSVEESLMKIAISQDEDGNFYIPPERFNEVLRDPMHDWKMAGFCLFASGAAFMALSLLVPTCAHVFGGKKLAAFVSEDNTPNEPPVRIYPSMGNRFKISPTKLAGAHKISPTSGPVPVMEEIAKVQPGKKSNQSSPIQPVNDFLTGSPQEPLLK